MSRNNATESLDVFNSQGLQIKYTTEYENDRKELNFLDVAIRNNLNHSYDFAVYSKPAMDLFLDSNALYNCIPHFSSECLN